MDRPRDCYVQFSSVQSLSHVQFFVTPLTVAQEGSLSITNSRRLLKLMFTESVMPSKHLILCCLFLLLPSIFPSIGLFSNESALHLASQARGFTKNWLNTSIPWPRGKTPRKAGLWTNSHLPLAVCVRLRLHLLSSAGRGKAPAGIPSVSGEAAT